jgi:hypothetical protein
LSFFVTVVHSDVLIAQEITMNKRRYRTTMNKRRYRTSTSSGLNNHLFVIVVRGGCRLSFSLFVSLERRSTALPMSVCLYVCLMDLTENGSMK